MIEINELTVNYKSRGNQVVALDKINLSINSGDTCAIIGSSGCGKSTLLKVLAGIERKYEGTVTINKESVTPSRQRIGFIPQNYDLMEWKTAYENAILGIKVRDGKSSISVESVSSMLKQLGVNHLGGRYPHELSGGQRQRFAIARSFLLNPDLLLMDEPFSALDALTREEIQDVFLNIWKEHKVTTLLVTHNVEEAIYLGKKIVIISKSPGKIIKIIDNPLFGVENSRDLAEYNDLNKVIRYVIKGDRSN